MSRDYVFIASWQRKVRSTAQVVRVSKDGKEAVVVHKRESLSAPRNLRAHEGGVVFGYDPELYRLKPGAAQAELIAAQFARSVAPYGDHVYGARISADLGHNEIVRVPITGGATELLYREPIKRGYPRVRPDYSDIVVNGHGIYLADETRRRMVRLSHGATELEIIAPDERQLRRLTALGDTLVWNTMHNVRRTSVNSGEIIDIKSRWTETDQPWTLVDDALYLVTARGNALARHSIAHGHDELIESLLHYKHFRDIGADERCVYLAMVYGTSVTDNKDNVAVVARLRKPRD